MHYAYSTCVVFSLLYLSIALANGSHGMGFLHKTSLVALWLIDGLTLPAACSELALMFSSGGAVVVGYVIAHVAELHTRRTFAEKGCAEEEKRRSDKERSSSRVARAETRAAAAEVRATAAEAGLEAQLAHRFSRTMQGQEPEDEAVARDVEASHDTVSSMQSSPKLDFFEAVGAFINFQGFQPVRELGRGVSARAMLLQHKHTGNRVVGKLLTLGHLLNVPSDDHQTIAELARAEQVRQPSRLLPCPEPVASRPSPCLEAGDRRSFKNQARECDSVHRRLPGP